MPYLAWHTPNHVWLTEAYPSVSLVHQLKKKGVFGKESMPKSGWPKVLSLGKKKGLQ